MYKSLAYKEWIKIRWAYLVAAIIGISVIVSIFLNLRVLSEFNAANSLWNYIIFKNYQFFSQFKYVPILIALIVSISQFLPEIQNLRLKLTLHLPVDEIRILLFMMFYGFTLLLAQYSLFYFILSIISIANFPSDITNAMLITITPWFLSGFAVYFFVGAIIIEQMWIRRIAIALFGFLFISLFFATSDHAAYYHIISYFSIFTVAFSFLIIISGYRFKRGVR